MLNAKIYVCSIVIHNKLDNEVRPRSHPIMKGEPMLNEVNYDIEEGPTLRLFDEDIQDFLVILKSYPTGRAARPPLAYGSKQD